MFHFDLVNRAFVVFRVGTNLVNSVYYGGKLWANACHIYRRDACREILVNRHCHCCVNFLICKAVRFFQCSVCRVLLFLNRAGHVGFSVSYVAKVVFRWEGSGYACPSRQDTPCEFLLVFNRVVSVDDHRFAVVNYCCGERRASSGVH